MPVVKKPKKNFIWKCYDDCGPWDNYRYQCRWAHGVDLRHVGLSHYMDGRDKIFMGTYCEYSGRYRDKITLKDPKVVGEPKWQKK